MEPPVHIRYLRITGTKYKGDGFGLRDVAAFDFTFDGKDLLLVYHCIGIIKVYWRLSKIGVFYEHCHCFYN